MEPLNYNKIVMKHFKHPKFMGKIENADSVGKAGNPTCLLPDEKIWINNELKPIKEAKASEKVISHEAKEESIMQAFKRGYNGKIKVLKNCLGNIKITPEHLIYAIKVPKTNKYLRNKNKKDLVPAWYHAEDLEKRDIVLYPVLEDENDMDYLEVNIPKLKFDYRSKDIPNKVSIDSNLLKLFGYFLAEGHIREKITHVNISFALHIKEKDIAEDIQKIIKNIFGLEVKIKEMPKKHGLIVTLNSVKVARWFKNLFGNGAKNKKIPEIFMTLPPEKQKALIYGFWKGDGYVNLNRNGPRAGYSTISYNLAQQIKILLLRQKIVPSYYEEKAKIVRGVNHQKSYRIHVGQRESLVKLCKILDLDYNPKSYGSVDSWFMGNYLYTPITKIEKLEYSGEVYNLEVENSHSFLTEAFTVHNCGDVMKVYLKIGKNKKGDEIIKDIKFQTFGCVAAIASTDALCSIAKGKTIREAEKIKKSDIIKKLKDLPKIKIHCSVLGAETLEDALKNYKKNEGKK